MTTPVRIQSAPMWQPNTLVLNASLIPEQIAGNRPGRETVIINNIGANPCLVSPVVDVSQPAFTIAAGGVLGIDTTGEVYVWSPAGTTVQTLETYFPPGDTAGTPDQRDYTHALGKV